MMTAIALGYGLDDWELGVLAGAGNFSLHHHVQTGSGAHLASYPMSTRGSFPEGKGVRHEATTHLHLVPRSKNVWSYVSTPQYVFMVCCLVKHSGNFTFTFTSTLPWLVQNIYLPSNRSVHLHISTWVIPYIYYKTESEGSHLVYALNSRWLITFPK
jgi:hypothetical protein